jgi:hypothetical protein
MAKDPGLRTGFKGLWRRGALDDVPSDHFVDSRNNCFDASGARSRDKLISYLEQPNIVRKLLYKPNPPYTGSNVPRLIYLLNDGQLFDENYPADVLFTNVDMKDFALVNFFGRCYISFSDGKVGLDNEFLYVYNGTGPTGFRKAAGSAPTVALTAHVPVTPVTGTIGIGTHLLSYAFETASGFITRAADPFVAVDYFGAGNIEIDNLPLGPAGTVARWIIVTQAIPFRANLGIPFDVATASFYPQFFAVRIADNTTTTYSLTFYDENLIESSDYLQTILAEIPSGVGLLDYKGRLILYGEHDNPSIIRASIPGDPETISETSGFLITDPAENTGIRSATEFRNILYFFKQDRGYQTQENQEEISTWDVVPFEKARGTEQYGIAQILDAKGATSEGFVIASRGAIEYFNGTFSEPELSYKIRDLWKNVNQANFYKMQAQNDFRNRRLYFVVPLNDVNQDGIVIEERTNPSHIIFGDYRDGLDPFHIKWDIWELYETPRCILTYNDFTDDDPTLVTRISTASRINELVVGVQGNDIDTAIDSYFQLSPVRYTKGISHFNQVRLRATGPCRLEMTAYGMDFVESFRLVDLSIVSTSPGREFTQLINLTSEYCVLQIRNRIKDTAYKVDTVIIEGSEAWKERAR